MCRALLRYRCVSVLERQAGRLLHGKPPRSVPNRYLATKENALFRKVG